MKCGNLLTVSGEYFLTREKSSSVALLEKDNKAIPLGLSVQLFISFATFAAMTSVFPLPGHASR